MRKRTHRDMTQQQAERFGPRRSVARTGVPADHFDEAPPDHARRAKRGLKAVRREIARRNRDR